MSIVLGHSASSGPLYISNEGTPHPLGIFIGDVERSYLSLSQTIFIVGGEACYQPPRSAAAVWCNIVIKKIIPGANLGVPHAVW